MKEVEEWTSSLRAPPPSTMRSPASPYATYLVSLRQCRDVSMHVRAHLTWWEVAILTNEAWKVAGIEERKPFEVEMLEGKERANAEALRQVPNFPVSPMPDAK